jgi:site-specific DNA-methyltransferase (adenine-specific)
MVKEYNCGHCGRIFYQKGHFTNHKKRKTPCKPIENKLIENKVQEKINELLSNNTIENLITNNSKPINMNTMDIQNKEGLEYLLTIPDKSIDLILTDPPYITSRETGMGNLHKMIEENKKKGIEFVKTEEEWDKVKEKYVGKKSGMTEETMKSNFIKYGSIYGAKYSVQTEYGDWDKNFTMEILEEFIKEYYKKLRVGGTIIIWFDLFKITPLKELLEKYKFTQIRYIEWIKTNPQPLNSKRNYLTNSREMALLAVKGGKPTFNSEYDNGIYQYPIQGGKNRFHKTQKSIRLFEDIIKKHSNEGDVVLDTFLGGGTTAIACKSTNRKFKGCEVSKEYYDKIMALFK